MTKLTTLIKCLPALSVITPIGALSIYSNGHTNISAHVDESPQYVQWGYDVSAEIASNVIKVNPISGWNASDAVFTEENSNSVNKTVTATVKNQKNNLTAVFFIQYTPAVKYNVNQWQCLENPAATIGKNSYSNWTSFKTDVLKTSPKQLLNIVTASYNWKTIDQWNSHNWYVNNSQTLYTPEWDIYGGLDAKDPAGGINLMNGTIVANSTTQAISATISIKGNEGLASACPIKATIQYNGPNKIVSWKFSKVNQLQSKAKFEQLFSKVVELAKPYSPTKTFYWDPTFSDHHFINANHTKTMSDNYNKQLIRNGIPNSWPYYNYVSYDTSNVLPIKGGYQYKLSFDLVTTTFFWTKYAVYNFYINFPTLATNNNITNVAFDNTFIPTDFVWR